jgi:dihydropteroate synthase
MHMQGDPATMQLDPRYPDGVVAAVERFFVARLEACVAAGIDPERLLLDPGFGFGKTLDDNLVLLAGLGTLRHMGRPLMVGLSRKSMLGTLLAAGPRERLHGSVAAALLAVERGARLVRVHDVRPTVEALAVWSAVQRAGQGLGREAS